MARLFLRGEPLGPLGSPAEIRAVLFDKDGTMSRSEPQLLALATARISHCLTLSGKRGEAHLADLLRRAYGLHPEGGSLDPAGITAVAARDHNLISTAVALTQVGHGWPESLAMAHETFRLADLDLPPGRGGAEMTEGLSDLLAALHSSAVDCAVISNDDSLGIQRFIDQHGFSSQISAIWSADHQPRKPDPKAIHQLCQGLGVAPANCALVGDANSDLRMAQSAGVSVVLGYRGGWMQPVSLDGRFPLLDHWSELSVEGGLKPDEGVSMETRKTNLET
jgi:phosphoglycolate phosphatase